MVELFFIITVYGPCGYRTLDGTVRVSADMARQEVYEAVKQQLGPDWQGAMVMFFSAEPNSSAVEAPARTEQNPLAQFLGEQYSGG